MHLSPTLIYLSFTRTRSCTLYQNCLLYLFTLVMISGRCLQITQETLALSFFFELIILLQDRCLALIEAVSDVQELGAVDDRDTFLHGVRDLLSIHSSNELHVCH